MRILHTADWHLGHRLYDQDRTAEHAAALNWLLDAIEEEKIDVVILAGDIFDGVNPSNHSRQLYFRFLAGLVESSAHAAVIVGGNHDSPSMLDAPSDLVEALNVHVVGGARTQVESQVIKIAVSKPTGTERLLVAAVPFLRDRDVRKGVFGQTTEERVSALKAGIAKHFTDIGQACREARGEDTGVPIVATGHLFVSGASDNEDKRSYIYQADENNIDVGQFPDCFDYVALGHVHRAQRIGGKDHVRYSGSLIPLSFVEGSRPRSVQIVELGAAGEAVQTYKLPVPHSRTLHRFHGTLDEVRQQIRTVVAQQVNKPQKEPLEAWAEARVKSDDRLSNLPQLLAETITAATGNPDGPQPFRFLRISQERLNPAPASAPKDTRQLDELQPEEVFTRICKRHHSDEARQKELLNDFRALVNWHQDQDQDTPPA